MSLQLCPGVVVVTTVSVSTLFFLFLRAVFPVEDPRIHQPLQDALVHSQFGSYRHLSGYGGGVSTQRADDGPVSPGTSSLPGFPLEGSREGQQAAFTEAVFAVELPGTPPTCVIGPAANPTLQL